MTARSSIFISYRRSDRPGYVRALMSDLRNTFGSRQVFLDMEDIEAGTDFVSIIEHEVGGCEVLLAVIGPQWLKVANELGQPRIHDPEDFIRLEIVSALKRKIPIIPVLVDKASMPRSEDLPIQLQALVSLQAVTMSHERWDEDMQKLVLAIENLTVEPRLERQYEAAHIKLKEGYWEDALSEFSEVESVRPGYGNIHEIISPLRQLAQCLKETGPETHFWQRFALKCPVLLLVVVSLMPHMLAALYNYVFNWHVIVHPMQLRGIEQAESFFRTFGIIVNSVFFSLGLVILLYLLRPISAGLQDLAGGLNVSSETLAHLRRRCLHLGHVIAVIGLMIWITAGPLYPILVGALEIRDYVYFIISLAISGLAVAAYPFLIVTWLCTHVYYRSFVRPGSVRDSDFSLLGQVGNRRWLYLLCAGALPMLVISLGFILGFQQSASQTVSLLLGIVGLAGLAGFVLAVMLFKAIQNDLELLHQLLWACSSKQNTPKPYTIK